MAMTNRRLTGQADDLRRLLLKRYAGGHFPNKTEAARHLMLEGDFSMPRVVRLRSGEYVLRLETVVHLYRQNRPSVPDLGDIKAALRELGFEPTKHVVKISREDGPAIRLWIGGASMATPIDGGRP